MECRREGGRVTLYGSMVSLERGAISSIISWKSPALNVWISDMVYFVPLSRASVRMRVAATRLARSMQFLTVRALEKYGNSLRRSMNSTNLALRSDNWTKDNMRKCISRLSYSHVTEKRRKQTAYHCLLSYLASGG